MNLRKPRTSMLLELLSVAVILGGIGFVAYALQAMDTANHRLAQQQQAQATVISRLSTGLDTTRHQLQQHGVTPKAPPARSIVQGVQGVPGVPGPAGPSGMPGSPGPSGSPGMPGKNGQNGQPGAAGSPGPVGPSGAQGSPGPASTVAGPAGPAGPQGPRGDTGAQGPKGDTGAAGPPPSGWTFTYPPGALGVTYTCTPDSPGSTHYSCAPVGNSGTRSNSPARSAMLLCGVMATAAYRRFGPHID